MRRNDELVDICARLDGYRIGFEVLQAQKNSDGTWDLKIRAMTEPTDAQEETNESTEEA